MSNGRRVLFLDDDPARGEAFLSWVPEAVWVQTAAGCVERLDEPWDEVHLDHDLGGETFVDHDRDDCGMEVVRWLCDEFRPHLQGTRFVVHTHNVNAACAMVFQLQSTGYLVSQSPFGAPAGDRPPNPWLSALARLLGRFAARR